MQVRVIEAGVSVLKDISELKDGDTYNHTSFGFAVKRSSGEGVTHVTTGDVRCDLGTCKHEEHKL